MNHTQMQLHIVSNIGPKKVVLFPEISQMKNLLLNHLHNRTCITIHIFLFKNTHTNKKQNKLKKKRENEKKFYVQRQK